MANKRGIDISRYQGNPDFSKVKSKVDFVIVQAGYGKFSNQKDPTFERNYSECKKHDIPIGAYWFSYATTAADAKLEAEACLEVIKGKKFEYPIYFDVEGDALTDRATVSACCEAFCGTLEKAGYFTGIYTSRSPAQSFFTDAVLSKYALWLAEYGGKLNWNGDVGIWQNSSTGKIPGIVGNVDTNIGYVDYEKMIKSAGLNGFKKESSTKPNTKKVLDNSGFRYGSKNVGVLAYKELLILAKEKGLVNTDVDENIHFGKGTEKCTNELLKKWGYKETGIMGGNLIKRLAKELKK